MDEVLGAGKSDDPISDYFKTKIEEMKLVDIVPNVLCQTCLNGRCGEEGLVKILDRFFLAEDLCENFGKFRSWSHSLGISDHKVVLLQIEFDKSLVKYPFKFNPIWLEDHLLCDFVKEQWKNLSQVPYSYVMFSLIDKLNKLREEVHDWERLKNEETAKEPEEIDVEIQSLTNVVDDIFFSYDIK